ncbi:MAG: hypothetical protein AAGJ94_03105 [Pseudomonadota bacterium]
MSLFDIEADAARAMEALKAGGIVILPNTVGYAALGSTADALMTIFNTKRRAPHKLNAMVGNHAIQAEIHKLSTRAQEIVTAITVDYDLPLGCIAPARLDHPMLLGRLGEDMMARSSLDGTLVMLLNAGPCHKALTALSQQTGVPILGSSANITMAGTNFSVEDIQQEIIDIADVVIDHGLQKFHGQGRSSTLLNVETLAVTRFGACYADIAYILKRHFGEDLPPFPAN